MCLKSENKFDRIVFMDIRILDLRINLRCGKVELGG